MDYGAATLDRMLSSVWRTDDFGRLMGTLERYLPSNDLPSITSAYEFSAKAHQGQQRRNGDPYISHPVAVAEILAGLHLDSELDQGGAAARRRRGHGQHTAGDPGAVRRRRRVARRRRQQDRPPQVRQRGRGASRELPQDAARDGQGPARHPREARRSHAQHAHDFLAADREAAADRARDARHLRADREPARRVLDQARARGLGIQDASIRTATRCSSARCGARRATSASCCGRSKAGSPRRSRTPRFRRASWRARSISTASISRCTANRRTCRISSTSTACASSSTTSTVVTARSGIRISRSSRCRARFKDYISIPRVNGYQSLHTTLFGPNGLPLEVQIRTEGMEKVAERGIAAHWQYKALDKDTHSTEERAREWLAGLMEMERSANSEEFLETVKADLFPDKVYVFTPKGAIMRLPRGATAVDFAYAVHTDIGNRCVAAKIDRRAVPLKTQLQNGETVEIVTQRGAHPNPSWVELRHHREGAQRDPRLSAQSQTRRGARARPSAHQPGAPLVRVELEESTEGAARPAVEGARHCRRGRLARAGGLGRALGTRRGRVARAGWRERETPPTPRKPLEIAGTEGSVVSYAHCCYPIPGDEIVGFMSSGRGIVIHRDRCRNLAEYRKHRPSGSPSTGRAASKPSSSRRSRYERSIASACSPRSPGEFRPRTPTSSTCASTATATHPRSRSV